MICSLPQLEELEKPETVKEQAIPTSISGAGSKTTMGSAPNRTVRITTSALAFIAWFFSLVSFSWCNFTFFDITLMNNNANSNTKQVSFGIWRFESFALVRVSGNDGNNSSMTTTFKVNTCNSYPSSVPVDVYWKISRAFTILAPILGTAATLAVLVRPNQTIPWMPYVFGLVAVCQGLVLLFLQSDICDADANPLFLEYDSLMPLTDVCGIGRNGILCMISMGFWFFAALAPYVLGGDDDDNERENFNDSNEGSNNATAAGGGVPAVAPAIDPLQDAPRPGLYEDISERHDAPTKENVLL